MLTKSAVVVQEAIHVLKIRGYSVKKVLQSELRYSSTVHLISEWLSNMANGKWYNVIHMGNRLAAYVAVWSICYDVKPFAIIYAAPLAICICHFGQLLWNSLYCIYANLIVAYAPTEFTAFMYNSTNCLTMNSKLYNKWRSCTPTQIVSFTHGTLSLSITFFITSLTAATVDADTNVDSEVCVCVYNAHRKIVANCNQTSLFAPVPPTFNCDTHTHCNPLLLASCTNVWVSGLCISAAIPHSAVWVVPGKVGDWGRSEEDERRRRGPVWQTCLCPVHQASRSGNQKC